MKNIIVVFLILAPFLQSCSTIRMSYKGEVANKDGRFATYKLKKSYEIEGLHQTLCAITAIFFGGYCWYYLVMPTIGQEKKIEADANEYLRREYGDKFTIEHKFVELENWKQEGDDSQLTPIRGRESLKQDQTPPAEQEKPKAP